MKDFDRDAASRPVSIPAQVDAPNDSDSEATRDIPPASVEDRSAKDRGRQDVVGSITDSDPSRALSTRVEGSAYFEPPRVLATTLHLKRPRTGVVLPARPKAPIVDGVARQAPALSERPGLPARGGDAPDGGGERTQNALSEPAAKNPPHSGATAAAPNATPSGETEPARGRAGSKMAFPASAIPLPADSRGLLTEGAVATRLSLSPATLRNWRVKGLGPPFVRLSLRAVRYQAEVVDEWIATLARRSTSDKGRENG